MGLKIGAEYAIPFAIPQVELLAGTAIDLVAPADGFINEIQAVATTTITTGGAITVQTKGTTTVDGLNATFANAAAKGTVRSGRATKGHASRWVNKGDRISILPAAAFDGAGAVNGQLILSTGN